MAPSRRKGANKAAAAAAARRQWKIGDLVLAKVKGFPAWPATVSEPEKWGYSADWKKVLVYFFGTQQIAFCNPADVEAFTEEKKESLLGKRHGKGADFVRAVREIIECYEKLKKQDHSNDSNTTVGHTLVIENNSGELSFANGEAPTATFQSCERKTHSVVEEDDENVKSELAAPVSRRDGLQDTDMPVKEDSSSLVLTELALSNVDSLRENSERAQDPKCFARRRPPSARHSRSSSRAVPNKLQTRTTRSGTVASSILCDGPGRRNKRIRKSPDIYGHDVDSPDLGSNGCIEGNDSEILTADSDSLSLNEGSTVESECKAILPDSTTELCQRNVELSHRLDFQTNGIYKKKRMPNRKRPGSDATEFTARSDEKVSSDADAIKNEHILPADKEILTERLPKEDGDEHLPLVKRARVRMGRTLSTGEQLESSLETEEKPQEVCSGISDHTHVSSDREGDGSTDRNPFPAKGGMENSSPPDKLQSIKHQVWEVRKYQHLGSSVEGEAALPPSKRLHRALEAMSANAAEDQTASDGPSTTRADTSGCCSPSSDDCSKLFLEIKSGNEFYNGIAEENLSNNNPQDGASECSLKLDLPIKEERVSSVEIATCCGDESMQQKSCKENVFAIDDKNVPESSSNGHIDSIVVVHSSESPPPGEVHLNEQQSPGVDLAPEDDCKTGSSELAKPSENLIHKTDCLLVNNMIVRSPYSGGAMETDSTGDKYHTVNLGKLLPEEKELCNGVSKGAGEIGPATEDSSSSLCLPAVMSIKNEDKYQASSNSAAHVHLVDKTVSSTNSLSPTYNVDTITHAKPHISRCKTSVSVNSSFQVDTCRSPVTHNHHDIQRTTGKWNYKEAHDALTSFEGFLGTLTRTKESIGRATRSAIDCAKFGVAAKVVETLAHSLEHEASLHRRVDLFFLVDSIAQCSRGLKGDVGGVYPSAILAVLQRLLSAAAPPGSNSQENRRQCLKVLRVWQERRILPESIVRHHIRELDSLCGSSCSRSFSRRLRNERSFDDPIREMEGMLVDEYGSNSSIQLPGFRMPPMLRDEDDGIDSDGESFEAVTPEHDTEKTEGERNFIPAVGKHRHILEDVDGELEMEDVAPSSEALISSSNSAATNNVPTVHHSIGNAVAVSFAPPLPRDVPPVSPPLPKSPPPPPPPPLAPRTSFPLPSEMPDSLSSSMVSKVYISSQNIEDDLLESTGQQSSAPGVNPTISDAVQSTRSSHIEFHSLVPTQIANTTHCSLNSRPVSNPPVRAVNNIQPSDGAFNKGFHLRPPHPAPSNQFSYVQADRRVQSQRDIPPPSHPTRFHLQNTENGNFYRDSDRPKLTSHDTGEHWRTTPFPGPRFPDGSRMPYTTAPYAGQPIEPALHSNHWAFPHGAMNHRVVMPHRPAGGPIPVAARGPNCWRPR